MSHSVTNHSVSSSLLYCISELLNIVAPVTSKMVLGESPDALGLNGAADYTFTDQELTDILGYMETQDPLASSLPLPSTTGNYQALQFLPRCACCYSAESGRAWKAILVWAIAATDLDVSTMRITSTAVLRQELLGFIQLACNDARLCRPGYLTVPSQTLSNTSQVLALCTEKFLTLVIGDS